MPLIDIDQPVPSFKMTDHTGAPVAREALAGSRFVLFFYPKDDSKDCTTQACEFSNAARAFAGAGVKVFGVSPDSVKDHQKFVAKHGLGFPILVDQRDASGTPLMCHAFGVWQEKSMYGRKYMGVVRTTYLVDADAKVERRWDKVKVTGHVGEVLQVVSGQHVARPAAKKATKATRATAIKDDHSEFPKAKKAPPKPAKSQPRPQRRSPRQSVPDAAGA